MKSRFLTQYSVSEINAFDHLITLSLLKNISIFELITLKKFMNGWSRKIGKGYIFRMSTIQV